MTVFNEMGHVTPEALREMDEYRLGEPDRVLVMEHLEQCETCMQSYLTLLLADETALLDGGEELTLSILSAVHAPPSLPVRDKKPRVIVLSICKFAVAAVLTFFVWGQVMDPPATHGDAQPERQAGFTQVLSQAFGNFTSGVQQTLNQSMSAASSFINSYLRPAAGTEQDDTSSGTEEQTQH